jgi:hypothetical protein
MTLLILILMALSPQCVVPMIQAGDVAEVRLCAAVARAEIEIGVPASRAYRMGVVAAWLADELVEDGTMTVVEVAAMLTTARGESGLVAGSRSHRDLPDEQQGGAFGPLQMTARTAGWLGLDHRQMRSYGQADQAQAVRYAARAALKFYGLRSGRARRAGVQTHLEALRKAPRPVEEMWTSWAAGHGARPGWAGVQDTLAKRRRQHPRYLKAFEATR